MNSRTLLKAANRTSFKTWNAMEGFDGEFAYLHDLADYRITLKHHTVKLVDNLGYSYKNAEWPESGSV